jgi:hypothetical protein
VPIVLDVGPNDPGSHPDQKKRVLFWRGKKVDLSDPTNTYEFSVLLEIKEDGSIE